MIRTHNNGELRLKNVGERVTLIGWVAKKRNLGSLVFIDLRDRYGYTQVIAKEEDFENLNQIKNEYLLQVTGLVQKKDTPNPKLATGEIEVAAEKIEIVNTSEQPPFIIADETDALEDTRLKYRYLDLRRPKMQKFLMKRAAICRSVRKYLDNLDFIEVETPVLTLSTPEGARDYLVPSRVKKGSFYALPQSPQLFKQLLMVGGMERYYQIARCFRDEDLRADRQPDFTQIDIETSFLDQDQIFEILEGLVKQMFEDVNGVKIETPFKRLPYVEAIDRYGSDKPDTRFGFELQDLKKYVAQIDVAALKQAAAFKAIVVNGIANSMSRKNLDGLNEISSKFGIKSLIALKYLNGTLEGSFTKFFSESLKEQLVSDLKLQENDLILMAFGPYEAVTSSLGAVRSHFGKTLGLIKEGTYDLLWIVDFPLFHYDEQTQSYTSEHHPFTRPRDEDLKYLDSDPTKVYGYCFDLVLNGYETLSGSLRIYDQKVQRKIFEILGLSEADINRKFGWFIGALKYGTPPHGGAAFGLDRLTMILSGTENIRDVIAFPKNLSATCPMTQAPMPVDEAQLDDLGIAVKKSEE